MNDFIEFTLTCALNGLELLFSSSVSSIAPDFQVLILNISTNNNSPSSIKKTLFGTEQWHGEPYSMVRVFPCSLSDRTGTASRIPKCSMLHVTGDWLVYLISVQVLPLSAPCQGTLKYPTKLIFLLLHLSRDGVMHNSRTLERTCSSLFGSRTRLNDRTEPSKLF